MLAPMHSILLAGVGAAIAAAPAGAAPASRNQVMADRSALDPGERLAIPTGWPVGPDGAPLGLAPARADGRVRAAGAVDTNAAFDLSASFGAVARGTSGTDGALSTLDSGFESLSVLPAELVGQNDTVAWGGAAASITGRPRFVAATAPLVIPQYGVVSDAIAGNTTKKLRALVIPAFGPNNFFGRWARYDFAKTNTATGAIGSRYVFRPDTGQDVRIVHDTFVNSVSSLWTSEPTYVSSGFVIGRLLWGGLNETTGIGLPIGPIPFFFTFCPKCPQCTLAPVWCPMLSPAFYRSGAPFPGGAGHEVPVPVGSWFRIISETTTDGLLRFVLDRLDGAGEFVIYEDLAPQVGRVDRIAWAGGYETAGDAMYVDNLHAEGVEFLLPTPPPLVCSGGQFVDDFEWMFPGPIAGQSTVVFDALSARAFIVEGGAPQNKFLRRSNSFNDDHYRRENSRTLPLTFASSVGPFRICTKVSIPSTTGDPNMTVQTIAPVSLTDNEYVTRLFVGRFDPWANPFYTSRVYAQINPAYNPIDDEATIDPYNPGPNGNGGVPIIGADVADTGVNWAFNAFRNVCFDVDQSRNMTVSVQGVNVHVGSSFVNSIDRIDFECENNSPGGADLIDYDDVALTCTLLPCVCGAPPFALVYNDDLEWGIENVTIGLLDDDNNPSTPFRWASAPNMPIVSLNTDVTSKWLKMENLFRDTPAGAPNTPAFASFTQASTALPKVTASGSRGWVARADMRLTDGTTSRTWSAAQATIAATQFARVTAITFSSVTGTFWAQIPAPTMADPFATDWIDSGTGLSAFGAGFNQNFSLSIARSVGAKLTFRINGRLLRFVGGPNNGSPVVVDPLASLANGTHKDLDRFFYLGSDENTAPTGSILYTDNIRAWSLPCLGDTNSDGVVNFTDLNNVLGFFGQTGAPNTDLTGNVGPDANNDGVPDDNTVTFADLNIVLSGFGVPCTAQQ